MIFADQNDPQFLALRDLACQHAKPDAPASITQLVELIAEQDAASPDQAVALYSELAPWALEKGDRLDQLLNQALIAVDLAETGHAPQAFAATGVNEKSKLYEHVAQWCRVLVAAGEHGSERRRAAMHLQWRRLWRAPLTAHALETKS